MLRSTIKIFQPHDLELKLGLLEIKVHIFWENNLIVVLSGTYASYLF